MVMPGKLLAGGTCQTCMMREGSSKGSGRRRTALTTEKIAVLAPMPRASTTMAAAEKPGFRRSMRKEKRKSESRFRMDIQTLLAHDPRRATLFKTKERAKSSHKIVAYSMPLSQLSPSLACRRIRERCLTATVVGHRVFQP